MSCKCKNIIENFQGGAIPLDTVCGGNFAANTMTCDGTMTCGGGFTGNTMTLVSVPAYQNDIDAAAGGLGTGDLYQTNGSGVSPLNVAGILMVKQ